MPTYTRQVDGVDTNSAADINELQVGIEGLSTGLARTTADRTTTSSTQGDVTDMSFAIGASETWAVEWFLSTQCSSTGGIRFAITVPSGATFRGVAEGTAASVTARTTSTLVTSGTAPAINFNNANFNGSVRITAVIVNSTTEGTVQLQFASTTAGQTSTVYANSSQVARRVA